MTLGNKRKIMSCVALIAIAAATAPAVAVAQTANADAHITISIPQQRLSDALRRLAEASGLQFVYDTKITDGRMSTGISGSMTPREALTRMLTGSGLSFQFSDDRTAIITVINVGPSVPTDDVRAIGVVRVEGVGSNMPFGGMASPVNGINGSRDVQATEGTGSYTTGAASIVSKAPQTLRETPQSVTVMTSQQIQDQSLVSVRDILEKITGVTVTNGGNNEEFNFTSRGFDVTTFTFDGGAPVSFAYNNRPVIDLAQYDSVQLIRGANGTFAGYGDPGGSVNLERKRPLDHKQFVFDQDIGSWSNFRSEVDVTGPITADGKLRARVVATRTDKEYYFDIANAHKSSIYGILEYDLTPATIVTVGASHVREDNVPNQGGLPRYSDGTPIDFPISTCLCSPYGYEHPRRTEIFGSVEQQFGKGISSKLSATYSKQDVSAGYINSTTSVGLDGQSTGNIGGYTTTNPLTQLSLDFYMTGNFKIFNRKMQIVTGASYQNIENSGGQVSFYKGQTVPDILHYNLYSYRPTLEEDSPFLQVIRNVAQQYGIYTSIKLEIFKNLNLSSAWRYSHFRDSQTAKYSYSPDPYVSPGITDSTLSDPNIGVTFDFLKNFTAYGSYQRTYQPQINTRGTVGVESPPPITGVNKELGLKWASPNGRLNASISVYDIIQNNFLSTDYSQPGKNITELTKVVSRGVDFEVAGELARGWQVSIGYSYNDNERRTEYGNAPKSSYTPHHILKTFTTYRAPEGTKLGGLILGGGVNLQSSAFSQGYICTDPPTSDPNQGCSTPFAPYAFTTKGYATLALKIGYQLSRNVELSLSGDNVTNVKTYASNPNQTITGYNSYIQPRSVLGSFRLKW